eukprot:2005786-Amphidinium_carterae.2
MTVSNFVQRSDRFCDMLYFYDAKEVPFACFGSLISKYFCSSAKRQVWIPPTHKFEYYIACLFGLYASSRVVSKNYIIELQHNV